MKKLITGIHHVTAIAGSSQPNIDFYAGILGLRLVKKTVNFDAPDVYHFYYGDDTGSPGSILTFFPYEGLVNGRHGKGMLDTTTFSVPLPALDYWQQRLKRFDIPFKQPKERFEGELVIYLEDGDGLGLELVFNDGDKRPGISRGPVPADKSIRGIYNVEIWLEAFERTAGIMTHQMDHSIIREQSNRIRLAVTDSPGNYVDLLAMPDSLKGLAGSGTVHHLAFATPDHSSLETMRERILPIRGNITPVLDRKYFSSLYFREPGGVLFEIATSSPGFSVDEPMDHLGESLQLPVQFESRRTALEHTLIPVTFNYEQFR
ncbi:VOC family protein [Flavihumibacter stibioxidans]|uniref:Diguanylate cyclase n=1 Tax=Flavihumibacter stibioxidans TaxID=1834163 RepID=A0ABR7M3I9_9BACT|nr:VOC family protein [Flavihumibacter stibioxidans]MBC6489547.1 diguanylate cyclase [Flavihumibacter stibioxidans]